MANTTCEEYSEKEKEALVKLREVLQDVLQQKPVEDYNLIRWLRARDLNVQKAEKMYRDALVCREKWHIDTILEEFQPPEVLTKYYSNALLGFTKNGRNLVGMCHIGKMDLKGIMQSVSKDDFVRYFVWHSEKSLEMMRKRTQETGIMITQSLFIQDYEGLSLSQMAYKPVRDYMTACFQVGEVNYPESLELMFIINAPKIFTFVYNCFSRLLPEATLMRIKVFGTNREKWIPAILEHVDANIIPVVYGGTRTDPDGDPNCRSLLGHVGKVPKSYYLDKKEKLKANDKLKSTTVEKGGELRLDFFVDKPGSVLRWEFLTEGFDIGFGVEFKSDGDVEEVLPVERVESHVDVQEGECTCEKAGKYVVIFDNKYSYMRAKQLSYNVYLCPPPEQKEHKASHQ